MAFINRLRRTQRFHSFINIKGTGSPKECAKRMKTSESTIYRMVEDLKNLGAEIRFCDERKSYVYENEFKF